MPFSVNIVRLKNDSKKGEWQGGNQDKVEGANEDGVWRGMTDSCGGRVVSLCRLWG